MVTGLPRKRAFLVGIGCEDWSMSDRSSGLLADIEAGIIGGQPLSTLLQKCIILGGRAKSEKLREWARKELHGYDGPLEDLPSYRTITAQAYAWVTNNYGMQGHREAIDAPSLPDYVREKVGNISELPIPNSIGEIEPLAARDETSQLTNNRSTMVLHYFRAKIEDVPNTQVARVYWEVPPALLQGLLSRIRTTLADLVAELIALTPEDQDVPDKTAADRATSLAIHGDGNVVNLTQQITGANGTNTNSTTAGAPAKPAEKEGWWARLRKRGILVAIATVVAAVVAVFTWIGWTPWS